MSVFDERTKYNDQINEGLFIRTSLKEVGRDFKKAQTTLMQRRGFHTDNFFSGRSLEVLDNTLRFQHLAKHRFVDMKNRGAIKKKSHPIHNRILYGHANTLIKTLSFGYVSAAKEKMQVLQDRMNRLGFK